VAVSSNCCSIYYD